ncbi:uncharacterized protein LOC124996681 [Mugil cephalus]|uniref:uncharacterized protein LOC124996681 n=1 Tax=Mugil cephalus TaxID=48193 RepID=UPI001FB81667|nr:uncharacterized protein LOC124996681 [Mugil cephalus]
MSTEKNPEVVGCDASIMKNVWEIRVREYGQKSHLELQRVESSALPRINQDWANRINTGQGRYKRVASKPKPVETQTDNNAWKRKQSQIPRNLPSSAGLGAQSRPGSQSKGFSTPVSKYKDRKGQDKTFNRLQLLMMITKTQPSAMVWGKSWKYNKSLPSPAEGSTDWGQCWMFASQQPCSDTGNPNGPNLTNPHSLHLWRKNNFRNVEFHELDLSLPEEWQLSWKKPDQPNMIDTSSGKGENIPKYGFSILHPNEALCSSEWSESWRSTKPANQQGNVNGPNDQLINESNANMQDNDSESSSKWEECWRIVNHNGNKSKLFLLQISVNAEWASSWRAAIVVSNNHKNSDPSPKQDHSNTNNKILPVFCGHKNIDQYLHLCNEFNALSEWSKSWQLTKNNSKPCEEIEKVLKALPKEGPVLESKWLEKNPKVHHSVLEKADASYDQLKHDVIYQRKDYFNLSKLLLLKQLEKSVPSSEWLDSWKIIKHRMRLERRRMKPDPLKPFGESEMGREMKPSASEWEDSWKMTCTPLNQDPNLWQQNLSSVAQISVNRERPQNLFTPVELPKNGPTKEQSWGESWMFSRQQHNSKPEQGNALMSQGTPRCENSCTQGRQARLILDWQASWMVSETEFHHDKPSLTQWRGAWRWSINHTQQWPGQVGRENWMDELMEIYPLKGKGSLQRSKAGMNWSFDKEMFRERFPETEWRPSWSAGSLLNYQSNGSPGISGQSISTTTQQKHASVNEHGSEWGRSFRFANPMPYMEHPWVESLPNPCHYSVMWSREKKIHEIRTNLSNIPKLWENSHKFVQPVSTQIKDKGKAKNPSDPRVIMSENTKTKRHLFSNTEEKQSAKKWAGSHLLGKTQPHPQKGHGSAKKLNPEDTTEAKFFEEWVESWRFLVSPDSLKTQIPSKSLSGWAESWKFLIPAY